MAKKKKLGWKPDFGIPNQNHTITGNALEFSQVLPKPTLNKSFRSYWSSPEAFATHLEDKGGGTWDQSGWEDRDDPRWSGTRTMEEAIDLARNGWKKGAEKASRLMNKVLAKYPLRRKPARYGIAGAYPNVARAIAGAPLNMYIPDMKKSGRKKIITLLSDLSVNCGTGGDELINRAAVVAALVDHIESAGYSCDVLAFGRTTDDYGGRGNLEVMSTVQVKNSNQPMDIQRLAFGLGHPAIYRKMMFGEWTSQNECRDIGSHLGSAFTFDKEGLAERDIYVLPSAKGGYFTTEEKAETEGLGFMVKALQAQGFPLFLDASVQIDTGKIKLPDEVELTDDDDC